MSGAMQKTKPHTNRLPANRIPFILALTGAGTWLTLAWLRLRNIPTEWWRWRDDAVITLSHARNLAEYGSIGVSPGIDRVEGFSAPLQFLVATAYYLAGGNGYTDFLDMQVVIAIAVSGALTSLILHHVVKHSPVSRGWVITIVLIGTASIGLVTIGSWTTFAWLVSGMENPYILVLGLAIIWARLRSESHSIPYLLILGLLIALLGLARIELPVVLLPIIIAVATWTYQPRSWMHLVRNVVILLLPPALIWGAYQVFRFVYFGQLWPNTALVQDKVTSAQTNIFAFTLLLIGFCVYLWLSLSTSTRAAKMLTGSWLVIAVISGITWVVHASGTMASILTETSSIAVAPTQRLLGLGIGGNGMLLALGALLGGLQAAILIRRRQPWPKDVLFASAAMIGVGQFLLFGPARLEPHRILSLAVPFLALWIVVTFLRLISDRDSLEGRPPLFATAVTLSGLGLLAVVTSTIEQPVEDYCCWVGVEQEVAAVSADFADSFLPEGALPISASPDLGKLTFRKNSLHVDLGSIGDPVLTRIWLRNPELVATYLNEVTAPDVVQSHHYWSREYKDWFASPTFNEEWDLVNEDTLQQGPIEGWEDTIIGGRTGFWTRNPGTEELRFTRELATASDPASAVQSEISECANDGGEPFSCTYVLRSIWRNSLALQESGKYKQVIQAIAESPSFDLDRELLEKSPGWPDRAYQAFEDLSRRSQ